MSFVTRGQYKTKTAITTLYTDIEKQKLQSEVDWANVLQVKDEKVLAWRMTSDDKPIPVPEADIGFFYTGDMYVVLKISNKNRKLRYDLHFWIGLDKVKKMAADPPNKVAQMMSNLSESVVLHREIEGFESPKFKRYFKVFGVLRGDSTAAFNPDRPHAYPSKLLHFRLNKDKSRTEVSEVPISRASLSSGDVYIFDEGVKMTQWNGSRCDEEERVAARKYIETALKQRKMKCTSEFYDQEDLLDNNELYNKLGNATVPPKEMLLTKRDFQKKMFRLSDESRKLVLTPVYTGKIYRSGINPDDVTFIDTFHLLLVYIGPGASEDEKKSVWKQADIYLKNSKTPLKSIAVFTAGAYCQEFESVWDDTRK